MQKGLALSGGSAHSRLGGQVSKELQARRESRSTDDFSATRSPATVGAKEAVESLALGGMSPPARALIAQFARLAEMLDAAGLGPADYLYSSLKWRLQRPRDQSVSSDTPTTEVAVAGV